MPHCAALNCTNSTGKGFRLHAFPVDVDRRRSWARYCGRNFQRFPHGLPTTSMKLCEAHFTADQYIPDDRYGMKLKTNAVPTIFGDYEYQLVDNEENECPENGHGNNNEEMDPNGNHQNNGFNAGQEDPIGFEEFVVEPNECVHHLPECQNEEHQIQGYLLHEAERKLQNEKEKVKQLTEQLRRLQRRFLKVERSSAALKTAVERIFAADQIRRLERPGRGNGLKWSEATIKEAFKIRMMTGVKGYEYMRTCGYPFPSYRTLCSRLESCEFQPGLNNEIISFLGMKLRGEEEINRNCYLAMDEMEIKKKIEFDKGLKIYVGFISSEIAATEEEKSTVASKVLAFVAKGLTLKWKQTVAYFFVGPSVDTNKLWECITSLIERLHEEGLNVRGIASDMGPCNVALWRSLGVHAIEGSIKNYIEHPVEEEQRLYFTADIAHLLKNLWSSLTRQDISLPRELAEEHPEWNDHLTASIKPIAKIVELQNQPEDRGITLQFKLHKYHVQPSHLQVMNVRSAAEVFSRSTSTALKYCAQEDEIPEIDHRALATAWFGEQVDRWFSIMNDRKFGINSEDSGAEKIATLEDFMTLFKSLSFQRAGWKPIQTGVLLSTRSTIDLHRDLVHDGPLRFLLPGRLTTDCLENLFSQVRQVGSHHPGPVETRQALRLISTSQFLYVPRSSNYENDDDSEYVIEFLKKREKVHLDPDVIDDADFADPGELTMLQEQGLYKTAGWVAHKVTLRTCEACVEAAISDEPLPDCPSEWTSMLSRGGLTHPSQGVYDLISLAEKTFNSMKATLLHCNNPKDTVILEILENIDEETEERMRTDCSHNIIHAIIRKFINLRVHVLAEDRTRRIAREVAYAGRACFMATAADARNRR